MDDCPCHRKALLHPPGKGLNLIVHICVQSDQIYNFFDLLIHLLDMIHPPIKIQFFSGREIVVDKCIVCNYSYYIMQSLSIIAGVKPCNDNLARSRPHQGAQSLN